MAKLYPPIIGDIVPAFWGGSLTVPFSLNRAVGITQVSAISLMLKSPVTNTKIGTETASTFSSDTVTFGLSSDIQEQLYAGGFVKVQIAFIDQDGKVGYYSDVSIAKYVGKTKPTIELEELTRGYSATYSCEDITEKIYSYTFNLYDSNGALIDTSGEKLHDSTSDVDKTQNDTWVPAIVLDNSMNCTLEFKATTINNLELSARETVTAKKDEEGYCPRGIQLKAELNRENGYVNITIKSKIQNDIRNLIYGTFEIFKTSSKDNFQNKYRIAYFTLENQDLYEKTFKDFTVESGYKYQYVLQQVNDYGIYSEEIESNIIEVHYEDLFLFDGSRQLKIEFNPKVSSFKDTILEQKMDTIGSKYPFIFRNKTVKYKEIPISGLISYQTDDENLFMTDDELWINDDGERNWTHNLIDKNIVAEKLFKLSVQQWLENGEPKLFKSPTEGNYVVRLLSVSLAPADTLGRMLHTFTATAYEIDSVDDYSFCQALTIDKTNKYIGYRTIPLYDFPLKNILYNNNGALVTISNNTLYEIIGNNALEYVTGVRFEDVKPLTQFKVILERGNEIITHTITIGATGVYVIPRELGFHIKSIKLVAKTWDKGDYGFDIINNRGQVTYTFERQAAHNNFNDITQINAANVVAIPWYPTKFNTTLQEPLTNADDKTLYTYKEQYKEEGYIEVAETANGEYIYEGKDYVNTSEIAGSKLYLVTKDLIKMVPWAVRIDRDISSISIVSTGSSYGSLEAAQESLSSDVEGYYIYYTGSEFKQVDFGNSNMTKYLYELAINGGCKYDYGDAFYTYEPAQELSYTGEEIDTSAATISYDHENYEWVSQTIPSINQYQALQVYKKQPVSSDNDTDPNVYYKIRLDNYGEKIEKVDNITDFYDNSYICDKGDELTLYKTEEWPIEINSSEINVKKGTKEEDTADSDTITVKSIKKYFDGHIVFPSDSMENFNTITTIQISFNLKLPYDTGQRMWIGFGDLNQRPGDSTAATYTSDGLAFRFGEVKGIYYINKDSYSEGEASTIFGTTVSCNLIINFEDKTVEYSFGAERGIATFLDDTTENCTGIEIYSWASGSTVTLSDIEVTFSGYKSDANLVFSGANIYTIALNNQGTKLYDKLVELADGEYRNPFYTRIYKVSETGKTDDDGIALYDLQAMTIPHYGLEVAYNTDFSLTGDTTEKLVIPRNFLANRYYNLQNVNGEYYNKETVLNLYDLNFQQIQVFYPEQMDGYWNFTYNGCFSRFEDIYEDDGYQGTKRMIGILSKLKLEDNELEIINPSGRNVVKSGELLYDIIFLGQVEGILSDYVTKYLIEKKIVSLGVTETLQNAYINVLQPLYDLPDIDTIESLTKTAVTSFTTFPSGDIYVWYKINSDGITYDVCEKPENITEENYQDTDSDNNFIYADYYVADASSIESNTVLENILNKHPDLYYKQITDQGSGVFETIKVPDSYTVAESDGIYTIKYEYNNETVTKNLSDLYLHLRNQAIRNYMAKTQPDDNTFIIGYEADEFNNPSLRYIDIKDRLDYHIQTDDLTYGIRNMTEIYLGNNVRGFSTYKRKGYSYRVENVDYNWSNEG